MNSPRAHLSRPPTAILVVDDDLGTRGTFSWALRRAGFSVAAVGSGREALDLARSERFDLLLLDLQLPDLSGIAVARSLSSESKRTPFMLMSAFLNTQATVEAMKLGALNVLEKPIDIQCLVATVKSAVSESCERMESTVRTKNETNAGSAAEKWAKLVLNACSSASDLRTLQEWARFAALSVSSLSECCRLVGVPAHDARDFARVLRAVIRSDGEPWSPEVIFSVSDRRTLEHLLRRAGIETKGGIACLSVSEFLEKQQFIASDNAAYGVLRRLLLLRFG